MHRPLAVPSIGLGLVVIATGSGVLGRQQFGAHPLPAAVVLLVALLGAAVGLSLLVDGLGLRPEPGGQRGAGDRKEPPVIERLRGSDGEARTFSGETVPLSEWSIAVERRPVPPSSWSGELQAKVPASLTLGTVELVLRDEERGGAWTGRAIVDRAPFGKARVHVQGTGALTWSEGS